MKPQGRRGSDHRGLQTRKSPVRLYAPSHADKKVSALSPMENIFLDIPFYRTFWRGTAYGDGTTEEGAGFGYRAARTTGKLSELAFSSGWTGASGQDYFAERFGKDEPGSCATTPRPR